MLANLPEKGFQILVEQAQNFLCHAIFSAYNEYAGQPWTLPPQDLKLRSHL